jgi:hypothetical protein
MKQAILKTFSAVAMAFLLLYNFQAFQKESKDSISFSDFKTLTAQALRATGDGDLGGGSSMGCYTSYILQCAANMGEAKVCDFTGSYGAPYYCTEFGCGSERKQRRCVQPS